MRYYAYLEYSVSPSPPATRTKTNHKGDFTASKYSPFDANMNVASVSTMLPDAIDIVRMCMATSRNKPEEYQRPQKPKRRRSWTQHDPPASILTYHFDRHALINLDKPYGTHSTFFTFFKSMPRLRSILINNMPWPLIINQDYV